MPAPNCAYEGCNRPIYKNLAFPPTDKCIFHCDGKDLGEFCNELALRVDWWKSHPNDLWDFTGWVFPFESGTSLRVFLPRDDKSRVPFIPEASFDSAEFKTSLDLSGVKFIGKASFVGACFSEPPNFTSCNFGNIADFHRAIFSKGAILSNATFWNEAVFSEAVFTGDVLMDNASFAGLGKFASSVIRGGVVIRWPGQGGKLHPDGKECKRGRILLKGLIFEKSTDGIEPMLNLRNNYLQDDCKLIIEDTYMERVLLQGTDCRRIQFENEVSWPCPQGRQIVGDEYFALKKWAPHTEVDVKWNLIDITYQQLTDRFRKDLNHPIANAFEQGIFEARLREMKTMNYRRGAFLLRLYKYSSYYGARLWTPFVWIIALTVFFAWCYGGILYGGSFGWPFVWQCKLVEDSLVTALRVISLDRGQLTRELSENAIGLGGRFLVSTIALLQTVLTATLVTLFIFAVRRRFKHSE